MFVFFKFYIQFISIHGKLQVHYLSDTCQTYLLFILIKCINVFLLLLYFLPVYFLFFTLFLWDLGIMGWGGYNLVIVKQFDPFCLEVTIVRDHDQHRSIK